MTTPQADIKSQITELSNEAVEAFCNDISAMFGVDLASHALPETEETAKSLEKKFKKLAAVVTVQATGFLEGNFHIILDKEGLFTLAGTIVMLPEAKVQSHRRTGSLKDAQDLYDAVGETGNLMVGSWDRIFREGLEGHLHFLQTGTFIGNPWEEKTALFNLAEEETYFFLPYEVTVGTFPAFKCGVIFSPALFSPEKDAVPAEPVQADAEPAGSVITETEVPQAPPAEEPPSPAPQKPLEIAEQEDHEALREKPEEPLLEAAPAPEQTDALQEIETPSETESSPEPQAPPEDAEGGSVTQAIRQMMQSLPVMPPEYAKALLQTTAETIMQKESVWAKPEDSVHQALTLMQQADAACLLVGRPDRMEGIVTWIDIAEAVSVYLQPVFARWHRPADDATLQIRLKIIMARPVRTVKPTTPLADILEQMLRHRSRCLPVVNERSEVQGIVTAFDIFKFLLKMDPDFILSDASSQSLD